MTLPPVDVVDLFPDLHRALMDLLSDLAPGEWERATVCGDWTVKDVALHMLGSQVGMISGWRDGYRNRHFGDGLDISSWDGLIAAIDRQNETWVTATRRLSPRLLIDLFQSVGEMFVSTVHAVDLLAESGAVDWAGPAPVPAWMQMAREYTEYWTHQQHIRDAVGRPGLTDRRMYHPVLDTFARAMPHNLRTRAATEGTVVHLVVTGEAGGVWRARREGSLWVLTEEETPATATVTFDQDLAWRLFTRGVRPGEVLERIGIEGDPGLAHPIVEMVTILA